MSLAVSREGRLLRLTLARPEKRNALSAELCRALVDAFDGAHHDPAVGAILLDAQGEVFCAGMDLKEALEPSAAEHTAIHERLFTIGSRIAKPIVAAVRGRALAGGFGLVANSHIVVADHDAEFALTEVRIGMWPFVVGRAMSLAIGERRAVELSLTARVVSAAEALQWGLVHFVCQAAAVEARAREIADALAHSSADAISAGLDFVNRTRALDWTEAGRIALEMRAALFASPDFREGVTAFREKRKPVWPSTERSA